MAGKALVENQISFSHLPTKLKKRIEGFTESWDIERENYHDHVLKEVEVVGWEEMRREIPSYTELWQNLACNAQKRWLEVKMKGAGLDLDELLDIDDIRYAEIPGSVSWPVGGVKVE